MLNIVLKMISVGTFELISANEIKLTVGVANKFCDKIMLLLSPKLFTIVNVYDIFELNGVAGKFSTIYEGCIDTMSRDILFTPVVNDILLNATAGVELT